MSHHMPYAGYGGPQPPPQQRDYGAPQHRPPPPPTGGSTSGYNANSGGYGNAPPYPYAAQSMPSHSVPSYQDNAPHAYGRERHDMYGSPPPPLGNQQGVPDRNGPGMPPSMMPIGGNPGQFGGQAPPYGPPIHFNGGQASGARPPPHAVNSAAPPQYPPQSYGSHDPVQQRYPPGPSPSTPNYPSTFNNRPGAQWDETGNQQQPRKRSRVEKSGSDDAEGEENYSNYLQERLARERPCRTLFVRNIEFNTEVGNLRARFESFGEIKTWFDLIRKRGIAFISYYDLRAAEAARNGLQGMRVDGGRELDVHFSLPREAELSKRCDRDKDQGTLFLVLKRAPDDLNDEEIHALLAPFGEIKTLRPYKKDQPNCRFVEYWDCRAAKAAHDALINSNYRGGVWDVKFAWDQGVGERLPDMAKHDRDRERLNKMGYRHGEGRGGAQNSNNYDRGQRHGSGGAENVNGFPGGNGGGRRFSNNGNGGGYGPGAPATAGTKRSRDYDAEGYGGSSVHDQPVMRRWGQAQNINNGGGAAPNGPPSYNAPPVRPLGPTTAQSPPAAGAGSDANRLEQAQKVQQLLASLKPASAGAAAPPSNAGGNGPHQASSTQGSPPSAPAPPVAALPSNIAALLQMAQSKAAGQQK